MSISTTGHLVGNVVLYFYLSRSLQPEGLGIYSTILAIFSTVSTGCGIGFHNYIPRELPKDLSQTNRYLIHAGLVAVTVGLVLMVSLDLLTPHLGYLHLTETGIFIISIALITESLQIVLNAIFIAHQKAEFIAATGLLGVLGRISLSLLILRLGFGVIGLVVVYTGFCLLALLVNFYFLQRYILVPRWEFDWHFLVEMLRGLKVFAALALLTALCSQSEVIVLSLTRGETQVGYYSAALKLVSLWTMVPTSYMTALFPILSLSFQESREKFENLQNRSIKYLLALGSPLAVGVFITAGITIPLFYGPGFGESISTLRLLSWYLPLIFINMVLWRVMLVRGDQRILFRWQFITEILQITLALLLTPKYGCQGAAVAVLFGNLAYTSYFVYHLGHVKSPIPLVQTGWRFVLASTLMGLFTLPLVSRLNIVVLVPVATGVYIILVLLLRAFSSEDIITFRQVLSFSKRGSIMRREVVLIDSNK